MHCGDHYILEFAPTSRVLNERVRTIFLFGCEIENVTEKRHFVLTG